MLTSAHAEIVDLTQRNDATLRAHAIRLEMQIQLRRENAASSQRIVVLTMRPLPFET